MKKIFKEAHKMTRKMVEEYGVGYQVQFGLNLSYLLDNKEEEMKKELKGTEKQVKWANEILAEMNAVLNKAVEGAGKVYKKEKSIIAINERVEKAEKYINEFTDAGQIIDKFKSVSYKKGLDKAEEVAFLTGIELPRKLSEYIEVALSGEVAEEVEFEKFGKTIKVVTKDEGLEIKIDGIVGKTEVVKENGAYHYLVKDENIISIFTKEKIEKVLFTHESARQMQVYL